MAEIYRVAAVSCAANVGDWRMNLHALEKWAERAAEQQAKLILFPELGVTGYSANGDLECCADGHEAVNRLALLAQKLRLAIAAGMAWRDSEDGQTYLAHGIWLPAGERYLYYKSHLGGREVAHFAAGNHLPVFELPGITVGIQMCLEHHFPDISQTLVLRGAQLILCPHATPRLSPEQRRDSWHIALRARAYDNCAYILAANMQGNNGKGLHYPGGTMAINPAGQVIAQDFSGDEALVIADLDLTQVIDTRTTPQGMCRRFYAPFRRKELYE